MEGETTNFDLIVLGGGSAGYAAARTAKECGKTVAVVDNSTRLGGLCILRGCMPSKALLAGAARLQHARDAEDFGIDGQNLTIDIGQLQRRKRRLIDEFAEYRTEQLESGRFELIRDTAAFVDSNTVETAGGRRLTARRFMVSTGSKVAVPPVPGLAEIDCWTSDDVLDAAELPESMIVLGGGVVACELTQYLCRVGVKVTQIQRSDHVLSTIDAEAAEVVEGVLRREGVSLFTGTSVEGVESSETGVRVRFQHEGEAKEARAAQLLNALGRRPATDCLGLDTAGIEVDRRGAILTDEFQQTSNPAVYACGDVTGKHEIVHVAISCAEVATKHAFGQPAVPFDESTLTTVVFTDPEIALVGTPSADHEGLVQASHPFDDHGKSMVLGEEDGFMRIVAEKATGRVTGALCVGPEAGELIHTLVTAVSLRATVHDLMKVQWYHPTLSEMWSYPIEDLVEEIGD